MAFHSSLPKRAHRPVVWGFPTPYNPNLMGDRCEACSRSDNWEGRPVSQNYTAWTCRCSSQTMEIPQD